MNLSEWGKIAKAIKHYYPREAVLPDAEAMSLWYDALKDIDYAVMSTGLKKWVMTNRFSPQIADLREMAVETKEGVTGGWDQAWGSVRTAIRRYGYYQPEEALESLDDLTRDAVNAIGFRELCISENPMADRAHFQRIYENLARRQKEDRQISERVRTMIGTLQGGSNARIERKDDV